MANYCSISLFKVITNEGTKCWEEVIANLFVGSFNTSKDNIKFVICHLSTKPHLDSKAAKSSIWSALWSQDDCVSTGRLFYLWKTTSITMITFHFDKDRFLWLSSTRFIEKFTSKCTASPWSGPKQFPSRPGRQSQSRHPCNHDGPCGRLDDDDHWQWQTPTKLGGSSGYTTTVPGLC